MIEKDSYHEYNHSPIVNTTAGSEENNKHLRAKILKLSTDLNMSKYIAVAAGAYSGTLHTLDIATKTYNKTTYKYGEELKVNKNGLLPSELKFDDRAIEEHRESTNFYVSLNTSAASGGSNYHAPNDTDMLTANAYIENMDGTVLTIDIYGDFKLCVDMKITCNIIKSVDHAEDQRGIDKYLSGDYIVTSINHRFEDEYIMEVLCKKDSYVESLDKIERA
jgi:type V secretory pathway adhesin AidA